MNLYDYDISASEVRRIIDEYIFNEKYRDILKRRFVDGRTYEQLAEEFELSDRQIKNIVLKHSRLILKHIP